MNKWNDKIVGDATVDEALALSDSYSDKCRKGVAIPYAILCLRRLAAKLRCNNRQTESLHKYIEELENEIQELKEDIDNLECESIGDDW